MTLKPIVTRKGLRLALYLALALCACNERQPSTFKKIENLKRQVETDASTLQKIEESDFPALNKAFRCCDSMLQYLDSTQWDKQFQQLNLTQAYLQQFAEISPEMHKKIDYSLLQLDRLKKDIEDQYITDSLASVYLTTEIQVADTLHYRILYFQEKFTECDKALKNLKKTK